MFVVIGWTQQLNSLALLLVLATRLGVSVARHHRPARHDYTYTRKAAAGGRPKASRNRWRATVQLCKSGNCRMDRRKKKGKELLRVISLDRCTRTYNGRRTTRVYPRVHASLPERTSRISLTGLPTSYPNGKRLL